MGLSGHGGGGGGGCDSGAQHRCCAWHFW